MTTLPSSQSVNFGCFLLVRPFWFDLRGSSFYRTLGESGPDSVEKSFENFLSPKEKCYSIIIGFMGLDKSKSTSRWAFMGEIESVRKILRAVLVLIFREYFPQCPY